LKHGTRVELPVMYKLCEETWSLQKQIYYFSRNFLFSPLLPNTHPHKRARVRTCLLKPYKSNAKFEHPNKANGTIFHCTRRAMYNSRRCVCIQESIRRPCTNEAVLPSKRVFVPHFLAVCWCSFCFN
jgi:hypothetical protein